MITVLARAFSLCVLAFFVFSGSKALAYNVPGSSAGVLGHIDRKVASHVIDSALGAAIESSLFSVCEQRFEDSAWREDCDWSMSARGGYIALDGDVSGLDYDGDAAFATVTLAKRLSLTTILVGGVFIDWFDVDTKYNFGTADSNGLGSLVGIIHKSDPDLALSLFGGVEFLDYDIARGNGQFTGSYDATRYFADASLNGRVGDEALWLLIRGGVRLVHQDNESYVEKNGGIPTTAVNGIDFTTFSLVSDLKLGHTFDGISPFLQLTTKLDVVEDEKIGFLPGVSDSDFNSRIGAGVDVKFIQGLMHVSSGVNLTEDGYQGFDVRLGLNLDF